MSIRHIELDAEKKSVVVDTGAMLAAGSDVAVNAVVLAAVFLGPLLAVAIFWLGIRHARKHDAPNGPAAR